MVLEDYKNIVASAAGFVTVLQLFSPVFMLKNVIKNKNTRNVDVMPFIAGLVISTLIVISGIIMKDTAVLYTNVFGFGLNLIYLAIYYNYTEHKVKMLIKLAKAVAFLAVIIGYVYREDEEVLEYRFGIMMTIIILSLISAPLLNVGEIIETKDSSCIPFPLVLSGTAVSSLWLLYSIIIRNFFMAVQNVVILGLSLSQLTLCFMYPGNKKSKKKD